MVNIVGVRFKKTCKIYDFFTNNLELKVKDMVIVETERGMSLGRIVYGPVERDETSYKQGLKKVIRKVDENDIERLEFNKEKEGDAFKICSDKIKKYSLPMKLVGVEYLFDTSKAIFSFISEDRVDFRELVKDLANEFHTRIEMRQIGVRDEAKTIGGIGPCGRELCCSSFLTEFEAVTVKMAKEQNINRNPAKISGVCGRLMCCLTYEVVGDSACSTQHNGCCNHIS